MVTGIEIFTAHSISVPLKNKVRYKDFKCFISFALLGITVDFNNNNANTRSLINI